MKITQLEPVFALWRGLQPRERLLVGGAGAFILVVLVYTLAWSPLQKNLEQLRGAVPKEHEQLVWMRAQASQVQRLRGAAPSGMATGGLLSFIEQSAQAYGVKSGLKRVEPDGANGARVALDGVPFNSLVGWLANLQKQGSVRVENATVEPQPASGIVNARLVLRGSGA
jgi:general secretion pathway protein M